MRSPEIAAELGALKPFEDGYTNAVADDSASGGSPDLFVFLWWNNGPLEPAT